MSAIDQPSPLAPTQSNATLEERLIEQARALIPTLRSRERAAIEAGQVVQNTNRGAPDVWTYSGIAEQPLADQA